MRMLSMSEIYDELEKNGVSIDREWKKEKPLNEYKFVRKGGYRISESRYLWEKYHGKVPIGMIIHHKNGNKKDNTIENLQLVSFQEHMNIHKELKKRLKLLS